MPSLEHYEHNADDLAVEVVGRNWSSEVISFFVGGLGGWAGGTKLPLVGGEGCPQGELRVSGFSSLTVLGVPKKFSGGTVTAAAPSSHRGRGVTTSRGIW